MSAVRVRGCTILLTALACCAPLTALPSTDRSGPTPYPTQSEQWPGRGVIRVFGWMGENRLHFWRERRNQRGSIVLAGDSLTAAWPDLADAFPTQRIANRGIGGDVSRGLLFRFEEDVLALRPKAIVLLIGTNDLTARQDAADTLANIAAMLHLRDRAQPDTPVFLCTVPPSANPQAPIDTRQLRILNEGLRRLAAERRGVALVDLYTATVADDGVPDPRWFKGDQLHLSRAGYERWQAVLEPALRAYGLL